jgi:acyl carrier protein
MNRMRDGAAIGLALVMALGVDGCGESKELPAQAGAVGAVGGKAQKRTGTVEERVRAIVTEQLGTDVSLSATDDLITKGKADSLDVVELVMAVEEEFDLEIPDKEAEKMRTMADIVAFVERKKGK